MYILGINGSPRTGGNTDILLDKVLEGAKGRGAGVEKVILNTLKFVPCQECAKVRNDGTCQIMDDMQPLYKKIEEADVIVVASPIFFGSLSAQTKMMIDRFQCAWRGKYMLEVDIFSKKKTGAFISVEGSKRKDFFDNAKSIVKNLFATINAEYKYELFCPGIDEKAEIIKSREYLEMAAKLGEKLVSG